MNDPYYELGLGYTATPQEIKKAYRLLAKQFHPDTGVQSDHGRFLRIKEAYEFLSDPIKKRDFDNEREKNLWQGKNRTQRHTHQNPFGMSDNLFSSIKDVASFFAQNLMNEDDSEEDIDSFIYSLIDSNISKSSVKGINVNLNISRSNLKKIKAMISKGELDNKYVAKECGKIISSMILSNL